MQKLTEIEKIILWPAIEDFADLSLLPGKLGNFIKEHQRNSLVNIAKQVSSDLIQRGFVDVYSRNINDPFEISSYIKLSAEDGLKMINEHSFWEIDTYPIHIYLACTKKGEEAYYLK
jgi:hypothetical protein